MLKTINANGSLKTTINAVSASSFINGGLAYLPDGALHVVIAGDILTDQFYSGGMAVTAEGALYITFDTPAASAVVNGGLLCRADGAVHVNVASGYFAGGLPISVLGEMYIAPQDTSYFYAPRTSTITQTRGAGTPTETRATVATVMGYAADAVLADGQTLLTVASGELRFQGARRVSEGVWSNVDAAGAPIPAATLKGALVEAEAENAAFQSSTLATAPWAPTALTPTNNAAQSLSGGTTATTLYETTANGAHSIVKQNTAATAGVTYCLSADLRYLGRRYCTLDLTDAVTGGVFAYFDLQTGVISQAVVGGGLWTSPNAGIEDNGDGSYRCWVSGVLGAAQTLANPSIYLSNAATGGEVPSYAGDITKGIGVENVNRTVGSYPSSRIATTTAAVTRNADVLDDQVASNLTAAAGTVAFTWTPSHDPSGTIALCGSYVDASNYTALLHDATKYIWRKRIAGVNYDAELTAAYANGTSAKIAMTWGASGINLAVDGVLGTAHANTDDAQLGTRWQWGADGNGGQQAGAAFKEMYLTPRTMSDAELQAITV